jgi:hypothetical protein
MTRNQIPAEVRQFVRREITSVLQVEVLLLLHGLPDRVWTVMEISQDLSIDPEVAEAQILHLEERGLIKLATTTPMGWVYSPKHPSDVTTVDKLATSYVKQRVGIFSLILKESDNRIRRFAEAFRLIRGAD